MDQCTCLKNIVNFFIPIETKDFLTAGFYIKDMDLSPVVDMNRDNWRSFMGTIIENRIKPIFDALMNIYDNDDLPWSDALCSACITGDLHFVKNCLSKMDSWERDYITLPFYLAVKNGHFNVVSYFIISTGYSPDTDDLTASVKFEEIHTFLLHLCDEDFFYEYCRRDNIRGVMLLLPHVHLNTLEVGLSNAHTSEIIREITIEIARRK